MPFSQAWRDFEPWTTVCGGIREVALFSDSPSSGVVRAANFASNHPQLFDADYWQRFSAHDWSKTLGKIEDAALALWKVVPAPKAEADDEFLVLALGDCPEIFEVSFFDARPEFRSSLLQQTLTDDQIRLFHSALRLGEGNVRDLRDPILSWNLDSSDFGGNNGYLAWGCIASLCLLSPLGSPSFRKEILGGRRHLSLLCGFEELFFPLALIAADNIKELDA